MTGPKNQIDKEKGTKLNGDECVSQLELKEMMRVMTEAFKKYQDSTATSYEHLDRRVVELVTRMNILEARPPPQAPAPTLAAGAVVLSPMEDDDDDDRDVDALMRRHLARNRQGM
jgi:hypothetical protein